MHRFGSCEVRRLTRASVKFIHVFQSLWRTRVIDLTPKRLSLESNGRRVMEPDWLKNYKKKQEKSEPVVFKQSIVDSPSYSRPIAPKLSGATYTVALPTGSSPSDRAQVAWVTITSSASPWKALTPAQPIDDACERENTLVTDNVASVQSSPTVRYV